MRRSTKLCSTAWNVTAGFSAKASRKASAVSSAISLSCNGPRARVGTRNLDWSNGGNGFRSLQVQLVAFLATASRGAAAITIFYRLYGER